MLCKIQQIRFVLLYGKLKTERQQTSDRQQFNKIALQAFLDHLGVEVGAFFLEYFLFLLFFVGCSFTVPVADLQKKKASDRTPKMKTANPKRSHDGGLLPLKVDVEVF